MRQFSGNDGPKLKRKRVDWEKCCYLYSLLFHSHLSKTLSRAPWPRTKCGAPKIFLVLTIIHFYSLLFCALIGLLLCVGTACTALNPALLCPFELSKIGLSMYSFDHLILNWSLCFVWDWASAPSYGFLRLFYLKQLWRCEPKKTRGSIQWMVYLYIYLCWPKCKMDPFWW